MTIYSMQVAFRYEFDRPAGAGRQLFRILPAVIPGIQTLLRAEVSIEPDPDETAEFRDFYGTRVIELVMPPGLSELELVLDAEVERIGHDPGLDISAPLSHQRPKPPITRRWMRPRRIISWPRPSGSRRCPPSRPSRGRRPPRPRPPARRSRCWALRCIGT
ncbi:transglutaminase N-terminal domain-containing protein [Paracoccus mutanolyticus]|uniref:transglutaminase N-terminal domain-containing protein n=1 Tax=Paracoccus mutanolyticus TaxID=1499308 RepID=UPI001CB9255B|nr:transglutaminase N-terminal domain-containing protein [Paracoccus mutanolyticus]